MTNTKHKIKNLCILKGKQAGMSLAEILVALVLMSGIGVVFLYSLSATTESVTVVDERNAADSIAKSQMEFIINQAFSANTWDYTVSASQRTSSQQPSWWDDDNPPLLSSIYEGYSVSCTAQEVDIDDDGITDDGVRKVTATVYHSPVTRSVLSLETHKVNR